MSVVYGDGVCPVEGCALQIPEGYLTCRDHWYAIPSRLRTEVSSALRRWRKNQITLGELRHIQDTAIAAAARRTHG